MECDKLVYRTVDYMHYKKNVMKPVSGYNSVVETRLHNRRLCIID